MIDNAPLVIWQILRLEFSHYDFENRGTISAADLGLSMAASADLSMFHHYLDRVQDLTTDPHFASMRISLEVRTQGYLTLHKSLYFVVFHLQCPGVCYWLISYVFCCANWHHFSVGWKVLSCVIFYGLRNFKEHSSRLLLLVLRLEKQTMGWKQQHENCHRCQCDITIDICASDVRQF